MLFLILWNNFYVIGLSSCFLVLWFVGVISVIDVFPKFLGLLLMVFVLLLEVFGYFVCLVSSWCVTQGNSRVP